MGSKKRISRNNLKTKMQDILSFKDEKERQEFDSIILHLETMRKVQELLDKNGNNRQWFVNQLKVSKSFVSQLFAGEKLLNFNLLARIEKIFNTKIRISFDVKSQFQTDAVNKVFDLSNVHPSLISVKSYSSVKSSNESSHIPIDDAFDPDVYHTSVPS